MTTAIDSNILIALWNEDDSLNVLARSLLDAALSYGELVVAAPVYAELLAAPSRTELFLDSFCRETGVRVDWSLGEEIWRCAGRAFQQYGGRRRRERDSGPPRIFADFLIGAHAMHNGFRLLTLDDRLYRAAFPRLIITAIGMGRFGGFPLSAKIEGSRMRGRTDHGTAKTEKLEA
jgi:predicted nucleic acid-binding protein